jgi:ubiquitin C-terminal hydrolase
LYSHPPILFIQLERFKYIKNCPSKTHTYFEFHSEIDFQSFSHKSSDQISNTIYLLYCVIVHHGSAITGHYFCYLNIEMKGRFYLLNDSSISPANIDDVFKNNFGNLPNQKDCNQKSAYMLIYIHQNEIKNLFPFDAPIISSELSDWMINIQNNKKNPSILNFIV